MYTTFYGLRELPFDLSPNPKYLLTVRGEGFRLAEPVEAIVAS